jgi:hypothetical protein
MMVQDWSCATPVVSLGWRTVLSEPLPWDLPVFAAGTRQHAEFLWRITKDDNQRSLITKEEIVE